MAVFGDTAQSWWQRVVLMQSLENANKVSFSGFEDMLEKYYLNNGLYDAIQQALYEGAIWTDGMKPLRNPAHRAVEFHVSHLWAGPLESALPIVPSKEKKNDRIVPVIQKIWEWSNWQSKKQLSARWYAMLGTNYIKVATISGDDGKVKRVYQQLIKPQSVTDFKTDERDFITHIRIDTIQESMDEQGLIAFKTRTEIWNKKANTYKVYLHSFGKEAKEDQMGEPISAKSISGTGKDSLGIDFIPIAHAKFQDVGEKRGVGVFAHALDKIDEANRQATRLHQILFRYNKPTTAIMAGGNDSSGRPLPPVNLMGPNGESIGDGDSLSKGDDDLISLPGAASLNQLVPNLQYDAALNILNAQMSEIEEDLPEVAYYRLKDKGQLSGRAIVKLLAGAIDRALEARGNAEAALVRANQMALTIGKIHQLDGFKDVGDYEKGDFAHSFAPREVIPVDAKDRADTYKVYRDAGVGYGPSGRLAGLSEDEVKDIEESAEEERQRQNQELGDVLMEAERRRDQNLAKK